MRFIERCKDNVSEVSEYYAEGIVVFEHNVLESEKFVYSICYCPLLDVYDVLLEDKVNGRLVNYEARRKLSGSTLKYFNVFKGDVVDDMFGNRFTCMTHHLEIKD